MIEAESSATDCKMLYIDKSKFNVLLAHRSELIDVYAAAGFDLALTGHAHGGQVRLFGRGLYAPNQGWFPKYTSGVAVKGGLAEVISRGLWGSYVPFRVFDRPELVYITF